MYAMLGLLFVNITPPPIQYHSATVGSYTTMKGHVDFYMYSIQIFDVALYLTAWPLNIIAYYSSPFYEMNKNTQKYVNT